MKLTAGIDGKQCALDVRRDGVRVFAEIDGRSYQLEAHETEAGVYLLMHDGRIYECRVDEGEAGKAREEREIQVNNQLYRVTLFDPRRLRSGQSAGTQASGLAKVVASMPGKVVRVLVEAGAQVEAGDGLIVIEAMKMQNELKSPKMGIVVEVRAQSGATVNAGDVLVVVE